MVDAARPERVPHEMVIHTMGSKPSGTGEVDGHARR